MPEFDKTGPIGQGPRTGGGFGICTDAVSPEAIPVLYRGRLRGIGRGGQPWGGGRGRGFGGGRGRRGAGLQRPGLRAGNNDASQADELIESLELEIEKLRARIDELESMPKE